MDIQFGKTENILRYHWRRAENQKSESGKKIASGFASDPSGIQIAMRLEKEVRGADKEMGRVKSWEDFFKTADGYLDSAKDLLQRVRELAIQYKNGTYQPMEKQSMQNEADELLRQLDRIHQKAVYNGGSIFNRGSFQSANLTPTFSSGQWRLHPTATLLTEDSLSIRTTGQWQYSSYRVPVRPDTWYTFSVAANQGHVKLSFLDANQSAIPFAQLPSGWTEIYGAGGVRRGKSPSNAAYMDILVGNGHLTGNLRIEKLMVNEGRTPLPYQRQEQYDTQTGLPSLSLNNLGLSGFSLEDEQSLPKLDSAFRVVLRGVSAAGSSIRRNQMREASLMEKKENAAHTLARRTNADVAQEMSEITKAGIRSEVAGLLTKENRHHASKSLLALLRA